MSVMQFASQFLVNEKLRNIEEGFDDKIKVVKNSGRTWRRGKFFFTFFTVILVCVEDVRLVYISSDCLELWDEAPRKINNIDHREMREAN